MKRVDIGIFEKKTILSIAAALGLLLGLILLVVSYSQERYASKLDTMFHDRMGHGVAHLAEKYTAEAKYLVERLIKTTEVTRYMKTADAAGLHAYFLPKWELLRKGNPHLESMRFYTREGILLTVMDRSGESSDGAAGRYDYIGAALSSGEKVEGFRHDGKYGAYYSANPVFGSEGEMLGVIVLELDSDFLIHGIEAMTGQRGFLFIEETTVSEGDGAFYIGSYRLHNEIDQKNLRFLRSFENVISLVNNSIAEADGKQYRTHLFSPFDLFHKEKVKLLFFEDMTPLSVIGNQIIFYMTLGGIAVFIALMLFISNGVRGLKNMIGELYAEHLDALEESEERFRKLYEFAPDAYQLLDSNGRLVMVNRKWLEMFGYKESDDLLGKYFPDLLSTASRAEFIGSFPDFKETGKIHEFEFDLPREGGTPMKLSLDGSVVYDDDGRIELIHCILFNITRQLEEENRRRFDEAYLQTVFDSAPNIVVTAQNRRIDRVNRAMLEFTGYETLEAFREHYECICDLFVEREGYLAAKIEGEEWFDYISARRERLHKAIMLKDGVEHIFLVSSLPLEIDETVRSITVMNDVTEFETINKALQGEKEKFTHFMANIPAQIIIKDALGICTYANKMALEWFGRDDVAGNVTEELYPEEMACAISQKDTEALQKGVVDFLVKGPGLDGRDAVFRCVTFAISDAGAFYTGSILTDITDKHKIQNRLLQSESKLKEAQEIAHIGHYEITYGHGMKITGSEEAYKVLCMTPESDTLTSAEYYANIVHEDDRLKVLRRFRKSLKNQNYQDTYRVHCRPQKSIRYVEVRGRHIRDEEGNIVRTVGTLQDVTAKMKADMELRKLNAAIAQSPLSIIITDLTGKIEFVNPWFCEITGYSSEEVIGRNPRILKSGNTDPGEYQQMWDEISNKHIWTGVFKNLKKNGEEFWEYAVIAPIIDNEGHITNYMAVKQVITEQLRLKEALKSKEKKTQQLGDVLEKSVNEIYIFDKESMRFLYLNRSAMENIGYDLGEMEAMTPLDIKPAMTPERFGELVAPLLSGKKEMIFFSSLHQRKDGSTYPADVYLQLGEFEDKEAYIAIISDVTEQEQFRKEIKDKEELMIAQSRHAAMGEMIGMIAHQWRQPITTIAMSANNILADIELDMMDKDEFGQIANEINEQTIYLSKTIDDFRNFFRPGREKEYVSVCDVFDETVAIVGKSLENSGVVLEKVYSCDGMVETYSRELLQVYVNIVKNAKEAMEERKTKEPRITVNIWQEGESVITEICDNGGGIAPENLLRIFDPYFSTKDEKTGTGLGLYMSETIVKKHLGGTLGASNCLEGACFKVVLPKMRHVDELPKPADTVWRMEADI